MQKTMQNNNNFEEAYRILDGINAAYKEMVEEKMLRDQKVVTADAEGNIRIESARECYERVYNSGDR